MLLMHAPHPYHICRNFCLTSHHTSQPFGMSCMGFFWGGGSIYLICSLRPNNTKIEKGKECVMKPKQKETRILILEQNMQLVRILLPVMKSCYWQRCRVNYAILQQGQLSTVKYRKYLCILGHLLKKGVAYLFLLLLYY